MREFNTKPNLFSFASDRLTVMRAWMPVPLRSNRRRMRAAESGSGETPNRARQLRSHSLSWGGSGSAVGGVGTAKVRTVQPPARRMAASVWGVWSVVASSVAQAFAWAATRWAQSSRGCMTGFSGRDHTQRYARRRCEGKRGSSGAQPQVCLPGLGDAVGPLVVTVEKVIELRRGRRVERSRTHFPGYLLCEVALNDEVLGVFHETAGVRGFVGAGEAPTALSPDEVAAFLGGQGEANVRVVLPDFDGGDRVRILGGLFDGMEAEVEGVSPDGTVVRVRVTLLGRSVMLEVEPFGLVLVR